jgi:TPR repeat protein
MNIICFKRFLFTISMLTASAVAGGELPFDRSYALVVGINGYSDPKWQKLDNAESDARSVALFLKSQNFEITELIGENATKERISHFVEDVLSAKLKKNDRVIIYFAGHGKTRTLPSQKLGYLVPYNAVHDKFSTMIPMEEVQAWSGLLSAAKHQLFILDSCFGGLAAKRANSIDPEITTYIDEITKRKSRQLLTAGGADQKVADSGDGENSLFTGQLMKALNNGYADKNGDGYITFSEVVSYLQSAASQKGQTPGYSEYDGHEQGDFVFMNPMRPAAHIDTKESVNTKKRGDNHVIVYELLNEGKRLWNLQQYNESSIALEKAVNLGNAEAMRLLGVAYCRFTTPVDHIKGLKFLQMAADRGEESAMKDLAIYYAADGYSPDQKKEAYWRQSAERVKLLAINATLIPAGAVKRPVVTIPNPETTTTLSPPRNLRIRPNNE